VSEADFRSLPPDLPAPVDDGAADHLPGAAMPSVSLPATDGGEVDLAVAASGTLVLYVYPRTGVPGQPLPAGWDAIPGARGCTPQSCAFRDAAAELAALGASVLGVSSQPLADQREFAAREHIPYPLLSDPGFELTRAVGLPTFDADGGRYYRRIALVARGGRIEKVFYPVFPPQHNAAEAIAWLRANPTAGSR
jgi:peroxiredoxin